MESLFIFLLGIALIIIGIKYYNYIDKNKNSIENDLGKLYNMAVILVISGLFLFIFSIISYFNNT